MKRIGLAGLMALSIASTAQAQGVGPGCAGGFGGGFASGGYAAGGNFASGNAMAGPGIGFINKRPSPFGVAPFGFLGLGLRMYSGIHQHGPLVNYGPYSGYYPFEPYGPWTSNLEYTGPTDVPNRIPPLRAGVIRPVRELRERGAFEHQRYALDTFRNVGVRVNPFRNRFAGCTSCGDAAAIAGGELTGVSQSSTSVPDQAALLKNELNLVVRER